MKNTPATNVLQLEPCPFCGGKASMDKRPLGKNTPDHHRDEVVNWIMCERCSAKIPGCFSAEKAARMWNTRAIATPSEPLDVSSLEARLSLIRLEQFRDVEVAKLVMQQVFAALPTPSSHQAPPPSPAQALQSAEMQREGAGVDNAPNRVCAEWKSYLASHNGNPPDGDDFLFVLVAAELMKQRKELEAISPVPAPVNTALPAGSVPKSLVEQLVVPIFTINSNAKAEALSATTFKAIVLEASERLVSLLGELKVAVDGDDWAFDKVRQSNELLYDRIWKLEAALQHLAMAPISYELAKLAKDALYTNPAALTQPVPAGKVERSAEVAEAIRILNPGWNGEGMVHLQNNTARKIVDYIAHLESSATTLAPGADKAHNVNNEKIDG